MFIYDMLEIYFCKQKQFHLEEEKQDAKKKSYRDLWLLLQYPYFLNNCIINLIELHKILTVLQADVQIV